MAISLKVDTQDFPSVLSMLGLGGMPRQAEGEDAPAPDPQDLVSAAQGNSGALKTPIGDVESDGTLPVNTRGPSKLQLLQHTLNGGSHDDAAAAMSGQPSPQDLVAASQGDTSGLPSADVQPNLNPGVGQVLPPDLANAPSVAPDATFVAKHPTLAKVLGIGLTLAQGAGAGAGKRTFGEGFQAAQELPIQIATEKANLAHTQAATRQMESQVTLPNGLTVPFALAQRLYPTLLTEQGKNTRAQNALDSKESIANAQNAAALRAKGLKPNPDDPNGEPVPLDYDELTPAEQGKIDLAKAQKDAADAKTQLDKFRSDPNSPQYQLAAKRLQIAAQNAATGAGKLGLDRNKYLADYFGMDANGNALPGAVRDENGNPIGPRMANATKPSADRLKRGDLANNAIDNLNDVAGIVNRRPDLFGPLGGRFTNTADMIGSDDPDISAVGTAIHNYALASNGAHGVRSQQAIEKTEKEIINNFHRGPAGIMGGINQAKKSLTDFVNDQQLGNRARPAIGTPQQPNSNQSGMIQVQIPGHPPGRIPANQKQQFLKDHPDARVF